MSNVAQQARVELSLRTATGGLIHERSNHDALVADLKAAHLRERALLAKVQALSQNQAAMTNEFERRLANGLKIIAGLLSLQSQAAASAEASAQLLDAARRVSAFERVHHRLHLLGQGDHVELKRYLQTLCQDFSELFFEDKADAGIKVEGAEVELASASAIQLGLIANELITNSLKYAGDHITLRLATLSPGRHTLSISDDGRGLPAGFHPAKSSGPGMKIIYSLLQRIGGELQLLSGYSGRGTRIAVAFPSRNSGSKTTRFDGAYSAVRATHPAERTPNLNGNSDDGATRNDCLKCSLHREEAERISKAYVAGLTRRERQVLKLVVDGRPSKNIAFDLGISQRTVENHRASIMKKLACKSLPALGRMSFAFAWNGDAERGNHLNQTN